MFGVITPDVNGVPKFFHREDLQVLKPFSKDMAIDPELMIKAKTLGFNIAEVPADFYKRQGGRSAVSVFRYGFEFLKIMIKFRWGKDLENWRAERKPDFDKLRKA
jgi:hypothetical protein